MVRTEDLITSQTLREDKIVPFRQHAIEKDTSFVSKFDGGFLAGFVVTVESADEDAKSRSRRRFAH